MYFESNWATLAMHSAIYQCYLLKAILIYIDFISIFRCADFAP